MWKYLLFTTLMTSPNFFQAQTWSFGLNTGVNLTTLQDNQSAIAKLGSQIGIQSTCHLNEFLGFTIGIGHLKRKVKLEYPSDIFLDYGYSGDNGFSYSIIELPFLMRCISPGKHIRLVGGTGLSANYLYSYGLVYHGNSNRVKSNYRKFNVEIVGFSGVNIPLNKNCSIELTGHCQVGQRSINIKDGRFWILSFPILASMLQQF